MGRNGAVGGGRTASRRYGFRRAGAVLTAAALLLGAALSLPVSAREGPVYRGQRRAQGAGPRNRQLEKDGQRFFAGRASDQ